MNEKKEELDPRLKFSFKRGQRTYYQCLICHKLSYTIESQVILKHTQACHDKFRREKKLDKSSKITTNDSIDIETQFKKPLLKGSLKSNLLGSSHAYVLRKKVNFLEFSLKTKRI